MDVSHYPARKLKVVAIDGPAGSGKSSVAREVARRLGWTYVTTGAIYRTLGLLLLERNSSPKSSDDVAQAVALMIGDYRQDSATGRVWLGERDITEIIKSPEISEQASLIASQGLVRHALLPIQRKTVLNQGGAVVDGRDMGTVVFPEAPIKIFLTASVEERVRRRQAELESLGKVVDLQALAKEISERDKRDAGRDVAPMVPADDALVIDSTSLPFEKVVEKILSICADQGFLRRS